jgi:large subunit ribosomal protein L32e
MIDKKLIHKQKVKSKKPNFVRQEAHKRKRLPQNWRKPKGVHSKLRLRRRGKANMVSIGYKMAEEVRGLTRQGLRQIMISSPEHLKYIKEGEVAVLKKVSNRTRLTILKAAQKAKVQIVNIHDIAKKIEEVQKKLVSKKQAIKIKEAKRAKKAEEEKKKAKMSAKQAEKQKAQSTEKLETKVKEESIDDKLEEKKEVKVEKKVEKKPEEITKKLGEKKPEEKSVIKPKESKVTKTEKKKSESKKTMVKKGEIKK